MNKYRGFASWSKEDLETVSRKGGKSGKGHRWTPEEAREMGKKGGRPRGKKRSENTVLPIENTVGADERSNPPLLG